MNTETISLITESTSLTEKALLMKYLVADMADTTRRVYASHIRDFMTWSGMTENQIAAMFKDTALANVKVTEYVEALKDRQVSMSTVTQALAAISKLAAALQVHNPVSSEVVRRCRSKTARDLGTKITPKDACTIDVLKAIICSMSSDESLKAVRDRALLLVGFAGAFRRSELTALKTSDLNFQLDKTGRPMCIISVRHSKTDQTGNGMLKAITCATDKAMCPVRALKTLLAMTADGNDDFIFQSLLKNGKYSGKGLSAQSVALIIKARAAEAGVELHNLSGHSLRRGFVTSAVDRGASERAIMNQTGHKSNTMVRRYIERQNLIDDNAVSVLFS